MPRKRIDPKAPRLKKKDAARKATEARRIRVVSKIEQQARFDFVASQIARDVPFAKIVAMCAARFQMSESSAERVRARVFASWSSHDREHLGQRKAQARRRIMGIIRAATRARKWNAVVAAEALLAKIDGIISVQPMLAAAPPYAPNIAGVLADLTEEQVSQLLQEQLRLERDAAAWRVLRPAVAPTPPDSQTRLTTPD